MMYTKLSKEARKQRRTRRLLGGAITTAAMGAVTAASILTVFAVGVSEQPAPQAHAYEPQGAAFSAEVHGDITVAIADGTRTMRVEAYTGDTVGKVLEQAGVTLSEIDEVSPSLETAFWHTGKISITRNAAVTIFDNGEKTTCIVPEGTTQREAAAAAGIRLQGEDYLDHPEKPVKDGMTVQVNRVTYETVKKNETAKFRTVEVSDDTMKAGKRAVETEGKNGRKKVTYREKLVNGKVVETEKLGERVTKAPVDRVVRVGTKLEAEKRLTGVTQSGAAGYNRGAYEPGNGSSFVDISGNRVQYRTTVTGSGTAYCEPGGICSTGVPAQVGVVAVNPNVIPYGSHLFIAAADSSYVYGYAVAGDTGGAMLSGQAVVDLYMNSESDCISFGRRNVVVYVLD